MDTTGRLPGGMATVAVCVIILMAIAIPITAAMVTLVPDHGTNDLTSSDKAVLADEAIITISETRSTYYVTVDGSDPVAFGTTASDNNFFMMSPACVVAVGNTGASVLDMTTGERTVLGLPVTITQRNGTGLMVTNSETFVYAGNAWVLYTWDSAFGKDATHARAQLPQIIGDRAVLFGFNSSSDGVTGVAVTWAAWCEGGEVHTFGSRGYVPEYEIVKYGAANVKGIAGIATEDGSPQGIQAWYVPYDWVISNNQILNVLLQILPVLLAVGLLIGIAAWMFPRIGRGGREYIQPPR